MNVCWEEGNGYILIRPYPGQGRKEIKDNMIAKPARISESERPKNWSIESVDFINSLLLRKQSQRLGSDRPGSAKKHPWFDGFNWEELESCRMVSPYKGVVSEKLYEMIISILTC